MILLLYNLSMLGVDYVYSNENFTGNKTAVDGVEYDLIVIYLS